MCKTKLFGVTEVVDPMVMDHCEHIAPLGTDPRHVDQKIKFWSLYENVVGGQPKRVEG